MDKGELLANTKERNASRFKIKSWKAVMEFQIPKYSQHSMFYIDYLITGLLNVIGGFSLSLFS